MKIISGEEVKNVIIELPLKKSTIFGDIPVKFLKQHAKIFSSKLANILNEKTDFTLVYKKDDVTVKQNYPPVRTVSNLAKVFEKYSQAIHIWVINFPNV